jgi:hypothetical protein
VKAMSRGVLRLTGLVIMLAGLPAVAEAQLVNREDPCFVLLFEGAPFETHELFTKGSWNNRDDVAAAAESIRERATWILTAVTEAKAQSATSAWTPADLERVRALNRCLPWLRRLLGTLEGHLKRLDITSVQLTTTRQHLTSDALLGAVRAELDDAERMLRDLLRP